MKWPLKETYTLYVVRLILTDSGVQKRLSDTLRVAVLFALKDGAGDNF